MSHPDLNKLRDEVNKVEGRAPRPKPSQPTPQTSGDCFVATAAFGTPLATEIQILRDFRDHSLRRTSFGRNFISFYYQHGPHLANLVRKSPMVKATIRGLIKLSIAMVKIFDLR